MKVTKQMLMIDARQLAKILREAAEANRGDTAAEAGVGSVVVRLVRSMPPQDREWFLRACGQYEEKYWLLSEGKYQC